MARPYVAAAIIAHIIQHFIGRTFAQSRRGFEPWYNGAGHQRAASTSMHKRHRAGLMLLLAIAWAGTSILAHSADETVTRAYRVNLPLLRFQKPPPPPPTPTPRPTAQPTVVPTPDPLGQLNQQERDLLTLLAAQRLA